MDKKSRELERRTRHRNQLVKAYIITQEAWRELRLKIPLDEFNCIACHKRIGIGDRVGYNMELKFLGFRCKDCMEEVLEAQRMN